eukprot:scaffold27876_cov58-Phaeocystis_antarctica.AAC.6
MQVRGPLERASARDGDKRATIMPVAHLAKRALAGPLPLKNCASPSNGRLGAEPTEALPRAVGVGDDEGWFGRGVDLRQCRLRCHQARVQALAHVRSIHHMRALFV